VSESATVAGVGLVVVGGTVDRVEYGALAEGDDDGDADNVEEDAIGEEEYRSTPWSASGRR
jgi:hypothetical protein